LCLISIQHAQGLISMISVTVAAWSNTLPYTCTSSQGNTGGFLSNCAVIACYSHPAKVPYCCVTQLQNPILRVCFTGSLLRLSILA
jgi:hypothetical protein